MTAEIEVSRSAATFSTQARLDGVRCAMVGIRPVTGSRIGLGLRFVVVGMANTLLRLGAACPDGPAAIHSASL
jgi:hypothetical protein